MASMTIRDLDDRLLSRLRFRAASHGRSTEEEARLILRSALATEEISGKSLVNSIRAKVMAVGAVELEPLPREGIQHVF